MKKNILVFLLLISTSSCGIYSLNGASIPPNAESISVSYFNNQANTINPNLSSTFTENLVRQVFIKTMTNHANTFMKCTTMVNY